MLPVEDDAGFHLVGRQLNSPVEQWLVVDHPAWLNSAVCTYNHLRLMEIPYHCYCLKLVYIDKTRTYADPCNCSLDASN